MCINMTPSFKLAKPVWAEGREKEMNLTLGFRFCFDRPAKHPVILRLTASSIYRFHVNGEFTGCGPARGPHDFYRVDEWDLSGGLVAGINIISIEVAGYNINSYYLLDQPSFLQAELTAGENIIAATGNTGPGFDAFVIKERIQMVQRYSFQRTFIEAYRLGESFDRWRKDAAALIEKVKLSETAPKNIIERRVAYPEFNVRNPVNVIVEGKVGKLEMVKEAWRDRALVNIGPALKGYCEEELEHTLSYELDELLTVMLNQKNNEYVNDNIITIENNNFKIFEFSNVYTGFIGLELECTGKTQLYLAFDEILLNSDVDYKRLTCVNGIKYEMEPGSYSLETMEPYTLKYLKLIAVKGQAGIKNIHIREYAGPDIKRAGFECSNEKLNRIYNAGVETFRQNATDIYMDCPSRERAGWLCDSFFTARVEYDLTGKSLVEKNFLENYLLPENFGYLPEGVLPMCYPADHNDGVFIPNWALWFVVELEEYLQRSGDREMVDQLKHKVYKLFKYFNKFKNEYGLLEKLESWIFVEWSEANNLVQDVNYPSNMIYAYALEAAGRLYQDQDLIKEAQSIRQVICEQAFDGSFFVDNALREDGVLKVTANKTEVCQYYAFFFKTATPQTHPELWKKLVEDFGPGRKETGVYPDVSPANAFIGNYLRLEILSAYGYCDKVVANIEDYFDYMAMKTGTLWEHTDTSASCDHGFASHVVHCLYRDALGVYKIDKSNKTIEIKQNRINAGWCEGWLPVDGSKLFIKWQMEGGTPVYRIEAPEGYSVKLYT